MQSAVRVQVLMQEGDIIRLPEAYAYHRRLAA